MIPAHNGQQCEYVGVGCGLNDIIAQYACQHTAGIFGPDLKPFSGEQLRQKNVSPVVLGSNSVLILAG
jgi:hypothetical protein